MKLHDPKSNRGFILCAILQYVVIIWNLESLPLFKLFSVSLCMFSGCYNIYLFGKWRGIDRAMKDTRRIIDFATKTGREAVAVGKHAGHLVNYLNKNVNFRDNSHLN